VVKVDGRFHRICQVAPVCPPMWAHWRHLTNMIEHVLSSAHPSPQRKLQIDRFSRFCTGDRRVPLYFTMGAHFPQNCPFPWEYLDPIQHIIPWAHPSPQPKRYLDQFCHFCIDERKVSLYFTMGRPFPLKIAHSDGCLKPPSQSREWVTQSDP